MTFSYEIGIAAGACFVVAFGMLNFGFLSAKSPLYQFLNFFGALGFTYTAISPLNPGLFILEAIWAAVALYGLWTIWTKIANTDSKTTTQRETSDEVHGGI